MVHVESLVRSTVKWTMGLYTCTYP